MTDHPLHASNAAAIASALWDSADFEGAGRHYERALQENPADLEALHGLGRLRLAQNELAGAAMLLEQALALALHLPHSQRDELAQRIRRDLAWGLYRLERFDLAAEQMAHLPEGEALAAQLRAFGDRAPYRLPPDVEELVIPFLGTDPLPVIGLTIGNQEHPFVIDTGSSQLVVDSSLLRELSLPNFGTREATFASGQRAPIGHTIVPTVGLGETTIRDVPAEVMDVRRFAPQISGFIGTNFLARFHLLFEWEGEVLRLRPRGRAPFAEWGTMERVPFLFFDSHLLLARATLNQHETMAYLASGVTGGGFLVPTSTVLQAGLTREEAVREGIGAGGALEPLSLVQAAQLCLGGWCRTQVTGFGGLFPAELEWRYGFRVGALLSHEFLHGRQWGIDFENLCFYFT